MSVEPSRFYYADSGKIGLLNTRSHDIRSKRKQKQAAQAKTGRDRRGSSNLNHSFEKKLRFESKDSGRPGSAGPAVFCLSHAARSTESPAIDAQGSAHSASWCCAASWRLVSFLPPTLSLFTRPRGLRGKFPGAASPAAVSGDGLFRGMSGFNGPSRHVDETVVAAACHRTYVR